MNTSGLLRKATEKLQEVKIKLKDDTRQLEKKINDKGVLSVNKLIEEVKKDDQAKILKLSVEINGLRVGIEDSTPLIDALKRRILSLKAKVEKEGKLEDQKQQNLIEEKMAKISKEFIPLLKKTNTMNTDLRSLFSSWKELSEQTGKMIFDKKVSIGSHDMLQIVAGVLISEWDGTSHGKGRQFYNRIDL